MHLLPPWAFVACSRVSFFYREVTVQLGASQSSTDLWQGPIRGTPYCCLTISNSKAGMRCWVPLPRKCQIRQWRPVELWWHTRRNQISSFGETDESILIGGGVSSVDYWQPRCAHQLLLLVVRMDTPCSEVVWGVLGTHSIRQFLLHFPSHASPCAIIFQLEFTYCCWRNVLIYGPNIPEVVRQRTRTATHLCSHGHCTTQHGAWRVTNFPLPTLPPRD